MGCDRRQDLVAAKIQIRHRTAGQLAKGRPQLVRRWPTDEVPAVPNPVDLEIGQQREGEGHRQWAVPLVGRLADAQFVGEAKLLVTQKRKARAETAPEGLLHPRRIDRYSCDAAVGNLRGLMELDQLLQL